MTDFIDDDSDNQLCFHGHEQTQEWLPVGSTRQAR
jgi:hypothetical protein